MGFGGPTNCQNSMNTHQKPIFARKKKKRKNTGFRHEKIFFFKTCLDEYSYNTPYL
jgi:hypothetical protein